MLLSAFYSYSKLCVLIVCLTKADDKSIAITQYQGRSTLKCSVVSKSVHCPDGQVVWNPKISHTSQPAMLACALGGCQYTPLGCLFYVHVLSIYRFLEAFGQLHG